MPTNWLKIPKSVKVTDFPLSSFQYLMYLAELCCDSKDEVLVDGRSWSRSCRLAVGVVGVVGTFSLPFNLRHSPCGFLYNRLYCPPMTPLQVRQFLAVMAGDCGDEIPSKSKPQPAGVTSRANPMNLLVVCCGNCLKP